MYVMGFCWYSIGSEEGMLRVLLSSAVNSVLFLKTPPSDMCPLHPMSMYKTFSQHPLLPVTQC